MTRSKAVSKMLITICFGIFGVHKFIEHKTKMGFLYLCTMGLFISDGSMIRLCQSSIA